MDVADVHLEDRDIGDDERIGEGDRGVGPSPGVDDDAADLADGFVWIQSSICPS